MRVHDGELAAASGMRQVQPESEHSHEPALHASRHDASGMQSGAPDMLARPAALRQVTLAQPSRLAPSLRHLQRRYGNQYVARMIADGRDAEGDAGMDPDGAEAVDGLEDAIEQSRGSGQTLDTHTQSHMESAFGADFSGVRVHTGPNADAMNSALNARAFTTGRDIFFKQNEYAPGTSGGRELLAHELTHVVQQTGEDIRTKLTVTEPGDRYEEEADEMAKTVMRLEQQPGGLHAGVSSSDRESGSPAGAGIIQRQSPTPGERARAGGASGARTGEQIGEQLGGTIGGAIGAGLGGLIGGGIGFFSGLLVNVPTHIRAASTPTEMAADRIPPRVDTPVAISVSGLAAGDPPVTLSIEGASATNGTVTIDGAATKTLRAGATVQLRGGTQTTPGNAGNLRLVAKQGTTEFARSEGFSVSAIPQNWTVTRLSLVTEATNPGRRGMRVRNSWESDSGNLADLDQAQRSESVETKSASGCFTMAPSNVSGYVAANTGSITDTHSSSAATMTSVGTRVSQQTFKFKDDRTGATDIPARRSGFSIRREVTAAGGGGFQLQTTKTGAAGTANGITSTAGAGTADSGQQAI